VKEQLGTLELEIVYIRTEQMLADVLTKPIGGELFHSMVRRLLSRHYLSNRGAKDNTSSNGADGKPELAAVTAKVIH
jgi:hypothetical protein